MAARRRSRIIVFCFVLAESNGRMKGSRITSLLFYALLCFALLCFDDIKMCDFAFLFFFLKEL
jgi:hypothetical protein